jgi:ABC transporter transmembrane region
MSIVNELLQGIRVVKLFAWENQFLRKIIEARKYEVAVYLNYEV